jgi:hypothetical protein
MAYILGIFLHLNRKRDPPVIPTRGRKTDPRSTLLSFLEMVAFSVRFNPFLSRLDGTLPPLIRYFVDKGISPLGEETRAFFSHLTSPVFICLQRKANSDISPVHKLPGCCLPITIRSLAQVALVIWTVKQVAHLTHSVLLHRWENMRIGVQSHSDIAMP